MKKNIGKKKAVVALSAIFIALMLTGGIAAVHYQNASVVNTIIEQEVPYDEVYYTGGDTYCTIWTEGGSFVIDGILSGEFTFAELQEALDQYQHSQSQNVVISFSIEPSPTDIDVEVEDVEVETHEINVTNTLLERLPEGETYCNDPPGEPTNWNFHPEALCLAAGMTPLVGIAIANGAVLSFFALFGPGAWATGMIWWLAILRGLGVLDLEILNLAATIYKACMNLIGGGDPPDGNPSI